MAAGGAGGARGGRLAWSGMEPLDEESLAQHLGGLDWQREANRLVKVVKRKDFGGAMEFVNAVAQLAEGANHHPDFEISWNTVTLRLTTHSAGGLTQNDIDLAAAIDDLDASQRGG